AMLPGGTFLLSEYALKGVTVGATQFNIIQALMIVSVFYLTRTVVAMGTRFLAKLPEQGSNFDSTLITPMQTALTYIAWAIFGLFVLKSLGMQLSNLAMVAGGLSVGIGFGMQNIVNNFISGLILIFGRTLQVGDVVEVAGTTGRVRKISVRATMVETYDNAIIFVPNSEFITGRLLNWTSFSRSVRREVEVGVAYGSNTEKVIKLLIGVANAHKNVLKYPVPSVVFTNFGDSALDFKLRFWVKDYDMGVSTSSDIRLGINDVFAKENIDISFPQLDVHIKDTPDCQPGHQTPGNDSPKSSEPQANPARPESAKGQPAEKLDKASDAPATSDNQPVTHEAQTS
ncbi:MAG: mechanosensitive ion channel, partial [Desulfovibrio sp.]|nr:mechanosensitive ion channel [Desulfovibrio sp.]